MTRKLIFAAIFACVGLGSHHAFAQSATIVGQVLDPHGAAVAGAQVLVTNEGQGTHETLTTNDQGNYVVPFLNPGNYQVTVQAQGFTTASSGLLPLTVGQTLAFNLQLRPGSASESVTVQATESLLQSETTVVGGEIGQQLIENLPDRNLTSLVSLSPSIAQLGANGFSSNTLSEFEPANGSVGSNINIGGYRQTGNYFILDGVSDTDWDIGTTVLQPSVESLQQLRVQTSTNSAAFGEVPGGTVNIVSRSGGNSYHGLAYDYLNNSGFNAKPYNFSSAPQPKPPLHANTFGAALGGPVFIPKLYQGRNRTFFYAHYEGFQSPSSTQSFASLPVPALPDGDRDLSAYGRTIYDPLSVDSQGNRMPFPGGIIPLSRIDPVALKLLSFMPAPTLPGITNNYVANEHAPSSGNQGNFRVDDSLGNHDSLTGTYHVAFGSSNQDSVFGPVTGTNALVRAQVLSLSETHVLTPHLMNDLTFGFNRLYAVDGVYSMNRQDIIGELGIKGIDESPSNWGFPQISASPVNVITNASNRPTNQRDNSYQLVDDATGTFSRHTIQFGFEFRPVQLNFRQANPARGTFTYTGGFTGGPNFGAPGTNTGLGFADFLLGYPSTATRTAGVAQGYLRSKYLAAYIGDTFRIRPDLTILAGLRYDYFAPPTELHNNYYNLDFSTLPNPPVLVQEGTPAAHNLPPRLVQANPLNFSPRVGIAWQPIARTVARAAYGIYRVQEIGALYYGLVSNGLTTQVSNSSPGIPEFSTANSFATAGASGPPSYNYIDPHSVTPYVQQWNAGVQRELSSSMMFEVLYAGAKGTHLFRYRSFNTAFQTETGADLPPRPGVLQQLRTWPSLGPIAESETTSSSTYNSLQLRLNRRFSNGISFLNSFTWGKALNDSDLPVQDFYENLGAQDERNLRAEKGLAFYDVRRRFSSAVLLETPFGKGKRYLHDGLAGYLVGPWQLSSIVSAQDGNPQSLVSFGSLAVFGTLQRPNVVPGQRLVLSPARRKSLGYSKYQFYNPAAVVPAGTYQLGDARRNSGPTPGIFDLDLSAAREFKLPREKGSMLFRADFANALNTVNFGIPSPDPTSTNFGQVLTTGGQRAITLSLKYTF
jgi:hypothetical protein